MIELKAISGNEIREDIDYNTRGVDPENKEWRNYGKELCETSYYLKSEVDAAIAELKAENRRLKRALWLARSYRGRDNSILLPSKFMRNVWDNVERKCLKKAEQYK